MESGIEPGILFFAVLLLAALVLEPLAKRFQLPSSAVLVLASFSRSGAFRNCSRTCLCISAYDKDSRAGQTIIPDTCACKDKLLNDVRHRDSSLSQISRYRVSPISAQINSRSRRDLPHLPWPA